MDYGDERLKKRFWSKVDKSGECWVWTASRDPKGYGNFHVGSRLDGSRKKLLAHRASWLIAKGPIPDGESVLHKCDNPPCIRPDHLFTGSLTVNMYDMVRKGRAALAKLKPQDVALVKSSALLVRETAALFGLSESQVYRIRNGSVWKCLTKEGLALCH